MREIHDLAEFDAHVAHGALDDVVIQGVDLAERSTQILAATCDGSAFLGCRLTSESIEHVVDRGGVVFPELAGLPFEPYRARLYQQGELLAGWTPDSGGSFERDALDSRIYTWFSRHARGQRIPVLDALAQRLHDHAIDDALGEHLAGLPDVVAVMGGHSMKRSDAQYREVAELGRLITREGWHVATGGGPGAMEAANLGAWLAERSDHDLNQAISMLAEADDFHDSDAYLTAGQHVLECFADGTASLAVPTWFYGHEPTNQFATHVAKYFANSIREDGLLALATRGVVFTPGSAGTLQEVFQDATQNHYSVFGSVSPMVFLGAEFWHEQLPAVPLLRRLAGDRPYAALIGAVDTAQAGIDFLRQHGPRDV